MTEMTYFPYPLIAPRTENKPVPLTGVLAAGTVVVFEYNLSVSLSVIVFKLAERDFPFKYVGVPGIVEENETEGFESCVLCPLRTGELFSDSTFRMPVGRGAEYFSEHGDLADIYG